MNSAYFYQEITCLPDQDISIGFVMGKVMTRVHLSLVEAASGSADGTIGLSFPQYRDVSVTRGQDASDDDDVGQSMPPIGSKVRVFSRSMEELSALDFATGLERLSDYVHITSPRELQRKVSRYAIYKRNQPKSSKDRLIRRQIKRSSLGETAIREKYATFEPRHSKLPYVNMNSQSTGQRFRLYIDRQITDLNDQWSFSTYGLSCVSTVPEF